jgi:hypothetical protein
LKQRLSLGIKLIIGVPSTDDCWGGVTARLEIENKKFQHFRDI